MLCAQCRHDPAPPWNSTSTGPSPHDRHTIVPSPHGVSVRAAVRFEPVQKRRRPGFDPIVHPVSICGYSWKARDAAATSSRSGHSIRNTRNHDDRLHRRHPPAMAQRRARPGVARSAAAGGDPARRHPVRPAARRSGGAAARSRHRRALDLRQPRQRRRPGDVGQPGGARAQSAHHARRAARAGGRNRRRAHRRPRRHVPPTHLGTARAAARASPRPTARGSCAASTGARSTSPR